MKDIFREATFGQIAHGLFGLFPYDDEKPDYVVPSRYLALPEKTSPGFSTYSTIIDEKDIKNGSAAASTKPVITTPPSEELTPPPGPSRRDSGSTYVAQQLYPGRDEQNDNVEKGLSVSAHHKEEDLNLNVTPGEGELPQPPSHPEYIIVTWNGDDDQENPRNWSLRKRSFVAAQVRSIISSDRTLLIWCRR